MPGELLEFFYDDRIICDFLPDLLTVWQIIHHRKNPGIDYEFYIPVESTQGGEQAGLRQEIGARCPGSPAVAGNRYCMSDCLTADVAEIPVSLADRPGVSP